MEWGADVATEGMGGGQKQQHGEVGEDGVHGGGKQDVEARRGGLAHHGGSPSPGI